MKETEAGIEPSLLLKYSREIVSAIRYCHEQNVCHRDIKAENVMLDEHGDTKLIDFGLSAEIIDNDDFVSYTVGSLRYYAPE